MLYQVSLFSAEGSPYAYESIGIPTASLMLANITAFFAAKIARRPAVVADQSGRIVTRVPATIF